MRPGQSCQQELGQGRNAICLLAESRYFDWDNIEPKVKVSTKLAFCGHLLKGSVSGGNNPDIDLEILHATEPLKSGCINDAQELGLQFRGCIADFIQEYGSPLR